MPDRSLRVLFTLGTQDTGGTLRYSIEVARELSVTDGVDVIVTGSAENIDRFHARGGIAAGTVASPSGLAEHAWMRWQLGRVAARVGADVVHSTKHLVPARCPVPRVLTVHDLFTLDRGEDFSALKRRVLPALYRASIADAERIVTVSETVAGIVTDRFALDTVRAVPNGIRADWVTAPTTRPAGPGLVALDGCYGLVVGDLSPRKNLPWLCELWRDVHAATGAPLVVAGAAGARADAGADAVSAAVDAGIAVRAGRVSDADLRWLYAHAAVVAVPSLDEGYGLPVAEAAALGAPVVASALDVFVEIGAPAALVPFDRARWVEALTAAVDGARPPAWAARTWADTADELVAVYRDVARR